MRPVLLTTLFILGFATWALHAGPRPASKSEKKCREVLQTPHGQCRLIQADVPKKTLFCDYDIFKTKRLTCPENFVQTKVGSVFTVNQPSPKGTSTTDGVKAMSLACSESKAGENCVFVESITCCPE